jgi:hypothetical protein|nr:MAG TPA: hypothetical protein [Caudoviricetes sp.]
MAWLAVNPDGEERIFDCKPHRVKFSKNAKRPGFWSGWIAISIPYGTIEILIGRKLKWDDEPVEI